MRQVMFILLFMCSIKQSFAQEFPDFADIDKVALNIPDSQANSTVDIARYMKSNFNSEQDKARAAYAWVTTNLKYDKDSANLINLDINPEARITVALRRRRGVCENFAAIYNDICLKSGLTSFVISGYTRQLGSVDRTAHSWCALSVNKTWYLCDPTWDVGSGEHSKYFLVEPKEFIESHMPFDPLWQLLDYPISHEQFYSGNTYRNNGTPYFNFSDSVRAYIQMDSLSKLRSAALRIQDQGLYNSRVKDNYNYIKMHIEMINQDKDVDLYNSSVADLNDATTILNNFIEYRNRQFTPEKTDVELQSLFDGVDKKLDSTLKKLDEVDRSAATLTLGTQPVRDRLQVLLGKIKEQKDFLTRYLQTDKTRRKSLFY